MNVCEDCDEISFDYQADEYGSGVVANDNAVKPKFKVGDKVRIVRHCNYKGDAIPMRLPVGSVHTIIKETDQLSSRGISSFIISGNSMNIWTSLNIEHFQPTAIVALIEDGQPKPATLPYVHTTLASAETEARRLSAVHRGKKFGVYALTGDPAYVAPPEYEHQWQRLAMQGKMVLATKELRAVSGIGLKAAKDSVEDWKLRQPTSVRSWLAA